MSIVKLNNKAVSNATAFGSITSLGSMVFIKKLTASSSATLSFVDGTDGVVLDDTYKEYVFTFNNMHPATNSVQFLFNGSTDGGSNYNVVKTTTNFSTLHAENDSFAFLGYQASADLAQSTNFVRLNGNEVGADNDQSLCATLKLFNPSSTTFVKHFISDCQFSEQSDHSERAFVSGYFNTTDSLDAFQFKFSSGNIDAGDICLYGIA
jgi:hypothetical protein